MDRLVTASSVKSRDYVYQRVDHGAPAPKAEIAIVCEKTETCAMAFDEKLAERVRERLDDVDGVVELKMFGGWGVTLHGNMAVGVMDGDLIVRVGPKNFPDALTRKGARPFDFTGRSMTGWVYVDGNSVTHGRALDAWVRRGVEYAQSLPAKTRSRPSPRKSGLI